MWLTNFPKVRIKKYKKWWSPEVQKSFFFIKYWVHIEWYNWLEEQPYYFDSKESALEITIKHFEWDILLETRKYNI